MTIPDIKSKDGKTYTNFAFFKKGGMGEVYKGIEIDTNVEVVLKLILIGDPNDEELLLREIDVSKKLSHKNIVKTLTTGKIQIESNDFLYIVQKYYPMDNLRSYIKPDIPLDNCLSMMMDLLNGMKEVHQYIIHRDLKPENILVENGSLLITDFGLARYIDEKTRTKSFKGYGTLPYMAPECWTGEENTVLMDIYSLGIIFYEILTGKLPFDAKTEAEWKDHHLFTPIPDVLTIRNDIGIKLSEIIQKMLKKKKAERYQSIDEIIHALDESVKFNDKEMKEIERLAALGHSVIQKKTDEELKKLQEKERIKNNIKLLNYDITELFNQFKKQADAVNKRLETEKISISEKIHEKNSTIRSLELTFNGKSLIVIFDDHDVLQRLEKKRYNDDMIRRKNIYETTYFPDPFPYQKFELLKDNIVLLGIAETEFKMGNTEFGYNLLLKREKDESYGDWYVMSFKKNITPPEPKFAISTDDFINLYERLRHNSNFRIEYRKFETNDITKLLEKILT